MITRIREVRRARGMTLDDVARACHPPTTPQTIGRLETGTRTVSIGWLNRIAEALGVDASDLVAGGDQADLSVAAILGPGGASAPTDGGAASSPGRRPARSRSPSPDQRRRLSRGRRNLVRAHWRPTPSAQALNRDVLVPRPAGRFMFGRLIGREAGKLHLLAPGAGARQASLPIRRGSRLQSASSGAFDPSGRFRPHVFSSPTGWAARDRCFSRRSAR